MKRTNFRKTVENVKKNGDIKLINNRKKRELFGIRGKLLHYKVFHKKSVGNRNEKTLKYS